jgi:hypothetical protein
VLHVVHGSGATQYAPACGCKQRPWGLWLRGVAARLRALISFWSYQMPASMQVPSPSRSFRVGVACAVPAAAVLGVLLLASCGPRADQFAPACPQIRLLPESADLTQFGPGTGRDVTDVVLTGRLTGFSGSCKDGAPGTVTTTLSAVNMTLTHGPATKARTARVTYFVAVADGSTILNEKDFTISATFPDNVDRINVTDDTDGSAIVVPVTPKKSAAAYTIYVAYRLTPEQLAYNRAVRAK